MKNQKITFTTILVGLALLCAAAAPKAFGVVPAPDGGYPGQNTAEGQNALLSLNVNTGTNNTAVGFFSLKSNVEGQFNTALGSGTLFSNTAHGNTAIGGAAMFSNTVGTFNTAVGMLALFRNINGERNTAMGDSALYSNTTGSRNTANGNAALVTNTTGNDNTAIGTFALQRNNGDSNTAIGYRALLRNTDGGGNTANGYLALYSNTTGTTNTANGYLALYSNTEGYENTGVGRYALQSNIIGWQNTAIGAYAGVNITGYGNVCIGQSAFGEAGVNQTTWISNVHNSVASARAVYVNADNKIGTLASSRRYKDEIRPMAKASEAILWLRPVSFRYKKEVDPTGSLSFGLIAEEVAEVDPDLVTPDRDGKPETVRYEAINAMLLNEFLKEHRKNEEQQATIAELKRALARLAARDEEQAALIQKVSAQLELSKAAPQTVLNSQ